MKIAIPGKLPGRFVALALLCRVLPSLALAQGAPAADPAALVEAALAVHPTIRAAEARVDAARAAVGPAGARPDPKLMAGVVNLPIAEPGFGDEMTMKMLGIGQMIPYPGKLSLQRRAAELEVGVVEARLQAARLDVEREVKDAYYELAFLDRALQVLANNQALLGNLVDVTVSRYGVGVGRQEDVLKAQVEAARLADEAVMLTERRTVAQARLNAALGRPSEAPIGAAEIPAVIASAAVADDPGRIRFTSTALGARAADSPLPPVGVLQQMAAESSPMIRERAQMIAVQAARVELSGREYLPDFEVSLQYGQRAGGMDMVTAQVSVPLPLQKRGKQDLMVAESRAELAALDAELNAEKLSVQREVAELHSMLEQARAQLALFKKSIIPQGQAVLRAATVSFQVGRSDFLTLLESQSMLYDYETQYHRLVSDFAQRLAELERVVGRKVL